jgi:catalase
MKKLKNITKFEESNSHLSGNDVKGIDKEIKIRLGNHVRILDLPSALEIGTLNPYKTIMYGFKRRNLMIKEYDEEMEKLKHLLALKEEIETFNRAAERYAMCIEPRVYFSNQEKGNKKYIVARCPYFVESKDGKKNIPKELRKYLGEVGVVKVDKESIKYKRTLQKEFAKKIAKILGLEL